MEHTDQETVGSLGEEALRFVQALATAHDGGETGPAPGPRHTSDDHRETCQDRETCQWCPLCRVVNFIRDNPEALDHVTASAAAFTASVRSFLDEAMSGRPEQRDDQ